MVIVKDKSGLSFLIAILVMLSIFIHGYISWEGGVSIVALKLHIYALPVSAIFILLAYNIYRTLKNRLVLTESGLLVEDFSPNEFPWEVIRRASTKSQLTPRVGTCLWLVLHTNCDGDYMDRKVRNLNRVIGINGIPVCNLANYAGSAGKIVEAINLRAKNA
jgi:hypothetical protein